MGGLNWVANKKLPRFDLLDQEKLLKMHVLEYFDKRIRIKNFSMKIISYNVNGIRAALKKGFDNWLKEENPDIVCIQELKAMADQIEPFYKDLGYELYTETAEKKGYSGVAILTKIKPKHIEYGCGNPLYDSEGRVIRADFEDFSVMSVYMPSGTSGDIRQDFKYDWLDFFYQYANGLTKDIPNLIISGDYNIAHTAYRYSQPCFE